MDLLYSRYASPMEFMSTYINAGRFGEFVTNILEMNIKRKKEAVEKDNMDKMWQMYIHSGIGLPEMSFNEFKAKVLKSPPQENQSQHQPNSYSMTNEQVDETLKKSRGILRGFSMKD